MAKIVNRIRDEDTGSGIDGVEVTIRLKDGGAVVDTVTTDADGRFEFIQNGSPGELEWTATVNGATKTVAGDLSIPFGSWYSGELEKVLGVLTDGVVTGVDDELAVALGTGLQVVVSPGAAVVKGVPFVVWTAETITVPANTHAYLTYVYRVAIRLTRTGASAGKTELFLRNTSGGFPVKNDDIWEMDLWEFSVAPGATAPVLGPDVRMYSTFPLNVSFDNIADGTALAEIGIRKTSDSAFLVEDGSAVDWFAVDTTTGAGSGVQIPNGKQLRSYSDAYVTQTAGINGSTGKITGRLAEFIGPANANAILVKSTDGVNAFSVDTINPQTTMIGGATVRGDVLVKDASTGSTKITLNSNGSISATSLAASSGITVNGTAVALDGHSHGSPTTVFSMSETADGVGANNTTALRQILAPSGVTLLGGQSVRVKAWGTWSTTAGFSPSLTASVKFGSTTMGDVSMSSLAGMNGAINHWVYEFNGNVFDLVGGARKAHGQSKMDAINTGSTAGNASLNRMSIDLNKDIATTPSTLSFNLQWSGNGGQTTVYGCAIEVK